MCPLLRVNSLMSYTYKINIQSVSAVRDAAGGEASFATCCQKRRGTVPASRYSGGGPTVVEGARAPPTGEQKSMYSTCTSVN